jgi:hypothetical protein
MYYFKTVLNEYTCRVEWVRQQKKKEREKREAARNRETGERERERERELETEKEKERKRGRERARRRDREGERELAAPHHAIYWRDFYHFTFHNLSDSKRPTFLFVAREHLHV